MGAQDRPGARRDPTQMVRPYDGEPGGPGAYHDGGAGQAACGIARRDRLRRLVRRILRRGGAPHLRRDDSLALAGRPHCRDQAAARRRRRDHAVELPERDDHSQGGARARRRLRLRVQAGRVLMAQCAPTIKKLGLELGGNAPFIVFDDADLDAAVIGAIASKYRNAGQTCVCANRLLVQDGVYDAFAAKLAEAVKALKVGDGFEPGVAVGPLINQAAVAKVKEHIDDALGKGARLVLGGNSLGGNFFEPTLIRDVTANMAVAREETFGPVAPLFRFHSEEEAIEMANATEFGL